MKSYPPVCGRKGFTVVNVDDFKDSIALMIRVMSIFPIMRFLAFCALWRQIMNKPNTSSSGAASSGFSPQRLFTQWSLQQ
jgi:hypothetical protein